METQNLQAIVNSWSERINISLSREEKTILQIMYDNAKQKGDVAIPADLLKREAAAKLNLKVGELEQILFGLGTDRQSKNCIGLQITFDNHIYRLRAAGWEAFESRRDVLKRLTLLLAGIHEAEKYEWIRTSVIAKQIGFGDYTITAFYLTRLVNSLVVKTKAQTQYGRRGEYSTTAYALTELVGTELAEYLKRQAGPKK